MFLLGEDLPICILKIPSITLHAEPDSDTIWRRESTTLGEDISNQIFNQVQVVLIAI